MQHYDAIDPQKAWLEGWSGTVTRIRSIVGALAGEFGLAAVLWLYVHWTAGVVGFGLSIAYGIVVCFIRRTILREIASDDLWHTFAHKTRDDAAKILKNPAATYRDVNRFTASSCQRIAKYFREKRCDPSVCCAIRLAQLVHSQKCYVTKGRSDGFDTARDERSKPIPADKGIANALRQKGTQGVIGIDDIADATKNGFWYPSSADDLPDVRFVLISPINGYEGNVKSMWGMLSITSKKRVFRARDTIPLRAFADTLGMIYPVLVRHIDSIQKRQLAQTGPK